MKRTKNICRMALAILPVAAMTATAQVNGGDDGQDNRKGVIDEVVWVVGDEAILRSDVETMRQQMQEEGTRWTRDPDCMVPEQLAVQKLFLHQAKLDTIVAPEAQVAAGVDKRLNYFSANLGSKRKGEG